MKRDLYEALEVTRSASDDELRKQYRKLARKYHPDLHPDDKESEERFKEVAVAYEVLSDSEKRKNYDEFGMEALNPNFNADQAREHSRWRGARSWSTGPSGGGAGDPFGAGGVDISDIFGDLFGRSSRRGGFGRATKIRGNNIESKLRIDLLDALRGTKVKFRITGQQSCQECRGTGQQNDKTSACQACHGTGQQNIGAGPLPLTGPCQVCSGTGRTRGPACPRCGGRGQLEEPSTITVSVPAGVDNGSKIRLAGKGEPGLGGGPAGDLLLIVEVRPHPRLRREGQDLVLPLPVTVPEAILGATVTVPLLEGEANVKVPPGSQSGQKLRLRGMGAPGRKGGAGDLILEIDVRLPEKASEPLKKAAEEMRQFYEGDLREELKL